MYAELEGFNASEVSVLENQQIITTPLFHTRPTHPKLYMDLMLPKHDYADSKITPILLFLHQSIIYLEYNPKGKIQTVEQYHKIPLLSFSDV